MTLFEKGEDGSTRFARVGGALSRESGAAAGAAKTAGRLRRPPRNRDLTSILEQGPNDDVVCPGVLILMPLCATYRK